jgi:polar amino acid transport system substrate-binding protein
VRRCRLLFFIAALACAAAGQAREVLDIAFDRASVPTMYADAHGAPCGIYPAIIGAAFARIGEPVRLVVRPFRRVLAGLGTGELAGGSVVMTPERARVAVFSEPYATEQVAVYYRAGSAAPAPGITGLHGKRIGVIRGWAYGAAFDEARGRRLFTVEEVDEDATNFRKLALGRVDIVLATRVSGELLRRQRAFTVAIAKGPTLATVPIRLAVSRGKLHAELLHRFDGAIAQMRQSGELAAIEAAEIERAARAQAGADAL